MIKDSKPINLVFRLCIFTVFALCTITSSKIILYTLRLAEADKNNDESTMLTNMTKLIECFKRFDWILWLTVICAVLSILTCYRATKISVVFRSVLLIIAAFLLISSKETNDSFIKIYTIFIDEGAELRNLSDQKAMSILIKAGIDSFKFKESPWNVLVLFKIEPMHIGAAGILLGHIRRIRREGIFEVGVLMAVISVILPDPRHRNFLEAGIFSVNIKVRQVKRLLQIIDAVIAAEFPFSVQHGDAVRCLPVFIEALQVTSCRNIISPVRHCSFMKNGQIFIMLGYDQCSSPP